MSFKKCFLTIQQSNRQNTCGTGDDSAVSLFGRFSSCFVEQTVLSCKSCDWKKVSEVKLNEGKEQKISLEIFPLVNFLHFETSWKVKWGTKWSQHYWDPREKAIIHSPFEGLRQLLKKKKKKAQFQWKILSLQKVLKNKELHNYYILLSLMYLDSKI